MLINANSLNSNGITKHSIFFLFGTDEGLIQRSKMQINKIHDPSRANTSTYALAQAREEVAKIVANSKSCSLFGEKKVIVIDQISGNIAEKFFNQFTACETAAYIFQAGSVKKTSKLFKYFQNREDVLTVQCYQLAQPEVANFIVRYFHECGKTISHQNACTLALILPNNIMIIERELEKLDLLTSGEQTIEEHSISKLFTDNAEFNMDDVIFKLFTQPKNAILSIENMLNSASDSRQDSIMLIRSILNHLKRILVVHLELRCGKNLDTAINGLKPPVFFKFKEKFKHLVELTSIRTAREQIIALNTLEKFAKSSTQSCVPIITNHFLNSV